MECFETSEEKIKPKKIESEEPKETDLDKYTSDAEEPLPLEFLSTVSIPASYQPISFPRATTSSGEGTSSGQVTKTEQRGKHVRDDSQPSTSRAADWHNNDETYVTSA